MKKFFEIDILYQKTKNDKMRTKTTKATIEDDFLTFENYRFLQFKRTEKIFDFDFIYKYIRTILKKKEYPIICNVRITQI